MSPRRPLPAAASLLAAALGVAACSGATSGSGPTSTSAPGGTATSTSSRSTSTSSTSTSSTTTTTTTTVLTLPGSKTKFTIHSPAPVSAPLKRPQPLRSFFAAAAPGEGQWHPAGRRVDGDAAVYETSLQEPSYPGTMAGIAWMDPKLLSATLYSGSGSPGHGPWPFTAPIEPKAATSVVAAFNGGFKFPDANAGYYDYGQTVFPLRAGAASLVIYTNGDATVAQWGRDVTMGRRIAAVRQNLNLLVDNGQPVPGLASMPNIVWGSTVGGGPVVWRSGLGVTADGALVYVAGPTLDVTELAELLVRAGAIRGMQLDINPLWPTFAAYTPATPGGRASPANGVDLVAGMGGTPGRFFDAWWFRDFITMSARPNAG